MDSLASMALRREIGLRMKEAREALVPRPNQEMFGREVARILGRRRAYTAANIGNIENGKQRIDTGVLSAWSELTGRSVSWLMTGFDLQAGELPDASTFVSRGGRVVPKITAKQAISEPIDVTNAEATHTHYPCSRSAFALDVFDTRNAPSFIEGADRIVIDPERTPQPGDMALGIVEGKPVFAQYVQRAGREILRPLNQKWDDSELDRSRGDKIIGTMTEHATPRGPGA